LGGGTPGGPPGGSSLGGFTFNLGGMTIQYVYLVLYINHPPISILYKCTKPNTKKIEIIFSHFDFYIVIHNISTMATTAASSSIKTYRHEFSKEFMAELSRFSKVHQYDDRHAYKSEWQKWINQETIAQAMEVEKRRLQENGYIGDIDDKMFKAGRYYFRKKTTTTAAGVNERRTDNIIIAVTTTNENETPASPHPLSATDLPTTDADEKTPTAAATATTPRRSYITMSKQCIRLMDDHICEAAAASSTSSTPFKPSVCYNDFYESKMTGDEMTKEIGNIVEKYEKNPIAMSNLTADELTEEIMDKIKKTYKNRYYKYISSTRNNNNNNIINDK
jgi:hypothetical protein